MIEFCLFGANEGQLTGRRRAYVTLFGGCELMRPTHARLLCTQRANGAGARDRPPRWMFFLTMFGATELKLPPLVDEYLDLVNAIRTGTLSFELWDNSVAQLVDNVDPGIAGFTLFGGFSAHELCSEEEELDAIALQRHLQQLPDPAASVLMLAIGQRGARRLAAVRQAAAAALLPGGVN